MKRVSRACLRCRSRKSRCDLDGTGKPGVPPCMRCVHDQVECVLGGSNRGGRRVRKNPAVSTTIATAAASAAIGTSSTHPQAPLQLQLQLQPLSAIAAHSSSNSEECQPRTYTSTSSYSSVVAQPASASTIQTPRNVQTPIATGREFAEEENTSEIDSAIASTDIRNPSDAWQLLTDVATRGLHEKTTDLRKASTIAGLTAQDVDDNAEAEERGRILRDVRPDAEIIPPVDTLSYRLLKDGSLTVGMISDLIARFAQRYHPYLPLVHWKLFEPDSLATFMREDPHLLTAVLTIASKDLFEYPYIHHACSKYMHELISEIVEGKECGVEAVEALLLLAEWEPQGLRVKTEDIGRGEEDRAAWMHVGLALRSGYFLGLDQTSFRNGENEKSPQIGRRRLAWACCYVADRLVSVRIGRAFWSRGPGPTSAFRDKDFPTLLPKHPGDEDYASIFQATLDLTQLYSNVHDILYSGMSTNKQVMVVGDYVKYIDDFRTSIYAWKRLWGSLNCSANIKATLTLQYEYLRLYTTAFSFQATISRAVSVSTDRDIASIRERVRAAFSEPASMPDARFIYESMDAAKQYLSILTNTVDPETCLRHLPVRFYLYTIYSAVFLYKARALLKISGQEELEIRQLVNLAIVHIRKASVSSHDLGSRYARLLELLWEPARSASRSATNSATPDFQRARFVPGHRNDAGAGTVGAATSMAAATTGVGTGTGAGAGAVTGTGRTASGGYSSFNPMTNFSWLDIGAIGEYVTNPGAVAVGSTYPLGNSPLQDSVQQSYGSSNSRFAAWDSRGWMTNDGNYLF